MNPLEVAAVVLGLANVALLVRRSIWNYPFGMAMVALYFVIFRDARLYGEAGLQLFFFGVQAVGWYLWARAGGHQHAVAVFRMGWAMRVLSLMAIAGITIALGTVMHRYTNAAMPFADAAITGASVVAQILLSVRRIENWVLWIAIDIGSIALYHSRGLTLTAGLYVAFLVLAIAGLVEWLRAERSGQQA